MQSPDFRRGLLINCRCGVAGHSGSEVGGNTTDSASFSGAEDDEMEREFDADYDYVNLTRIGNMTKEEVCVLFPLEKGFRKFE